MSYFFVSRDVLKSGDALQAGHHWQKNVLGIGDSPTNDTNGEFIRERVRHLHYPFKPSRTRCSFAFSTMADAVLFRDNWRPGSLIYPVDFTNPGAPRHEVTYTAFQPASSLPMRVQAHEFWNGGMLYSSNIETFCESDLVVL